MPFLVNSELVSEEMIREESDRLAGDPGLRAIPDEIERSLRLRQAAEESAIGRLLVQQVAAGDPRPVEPEAIEQEMQRQKAAGGCRSAFDDSLLRRQIELHLRVRRTTGELVASAHRPAKGEIE